MLNIPVGENKTLLMVELFLGEIKYIAESII